MKKRWKMFLLIAALLCLPITAVAYEGAVRVDGQAVPTDGKWYDYKMEEGEYVYCPITLENNGTLDVSVQTEYESTHYIYLLDQNYETIYYNSISSSNEASPVVKNYLFDLVAGDYYVRVEARGEGKGTFHVKAVFTESVTEDENLNINFQTARACEEEQMMGFLSSRSDGQLWPESLPERSQNFADYYKLDAVEGTYNIKVTGMNPESSFSYTVYNDSYQNISQQYDSRLLSVDLKEGNYYLCVASSIKSAGDYVLKIDAPEEETETESEIEIETEPEPESEIETGEDVLDMGIPKVEIKVGDTAELKTKEISAEMNWGSTDSSVVVVSKYGMIIGLQTGTAWVAGLPTDGSAMILYRVTVE